MPGAVAPLNDVGVWARSSGLEIVLFVIGAVLLTRLATWLSGRITTRIDASSPADGDAVLRTEAAKHRHAVTQVVTWTFLVLVYCVAAVLVLQRLGVPLNGFVAPATVAGVALGFGAQRIVQDVLAGFFMVAERQYGFGDLVRLNVSGVTAPVTGTVEEVTLRITRVRAAGRRGRHHAERADRPGHQPVPGLGAGRGGRPGAGQRRRGCGEHAAGPGRGRCLRRPGTA